MRSFVATLAAATLLYVAAATAIGRRPELPAAKHAARAIAKMSARGVANFGRRVSGPIPLPTHIVKLSVNRSPHVDKKSMEQFETRTHKRLIDIIEPTAQTVDELKKLNLPSGVDITINV